MNYKETAEAYSELYDDYTALIDKYSDKMSPAVFLAGIFSFATETSYECAPSVEEADKFIKDMTVYVKKELEAEADNDQTI